MTVSFSLHQNAVLIDRDRCSRVGERDVVEGKASYFHFFNDSIDHEILRSLWHAPLFHGVLHWGYSCPG